MSISSKYINHRSSYSSYNVRMPPHSLEAEQSIIGSLMLNNDYWDEISDKINCNDFFNKSHQLIFQEMHELCDIGKPIDLITVSESLEQKGKLKLVGGFAYLAELSKNIPSTTNIFIYSEIVRERAIIRQIIHVAQEIFDAGYNPKGRSSSDLLDLAESRVFQIAENQNRKNEGPKNIESVLTNTVEKIEKLYQEPKNEIIGISSGYQDLDKKTSGLQKSDLIIIAARPSMGKTTFAINLCEYAAINESKPVLIFSLEMSGEQIMMRILSSLSRVDQSRLRTGKLTKEDWERISNTVETLLKKKNIYIDDSSKLTITEIRSRSRRIFREHSGLSLIMIDYLQLMHAPTIFNNRTLEIAEISRSLKALAKELQVPVIALSQLNRSLEQRSDKRPINSDLRESGSIEQDADVIMFIYRDEVYNENNETKGVAEIILGKQRNGPIGTIRLTFNGKWSRFDNYSHNYYE
ncbi:replicative DNA helicase [Wigglesworthia glossinidia endosymbiont of Glossina morsitans morsitans (Yale colony)]|uniref:Replicative DNA helicase n=1 Tax=Wigglesworthia glossinidia endosymbiont of Glossina morsitans morsitans (Yale colony) TaxID=1142511 RepID=H6Q4N9_WIGGL|nr:replicative DNA helicase [Wigglesworthia glossinidia]AFA41099.1 replicative DNA helicase [Wigglesworthia glossinidia endosymbiont of Glossina morsitans morsitans (Yale colony)]